MFVLLSLHAVAGVVALLGGRRLGRRALLLAGLAPLAVVGWALWHANAIVDGEPVTAGFDWVPALGLSVDLRADAFSLLMIVLVSGIGALVFAYAWSYFGDPAKAAKVAGLLVLFAGSMLGLVLADNLLLLYVAWELTSVTSFLLIGIDDANAEARASALHALLVTGMGGLAMLGGLVLLGFEAGTFRISELVANPPGGDVVSVALVLVLVGAFTKSAQYPFHSWLPGAMVAPTPISAYLHSAAMVKAGVYLVARLSPAFADAGIWRELVVTVGLLTMIAGGLRALRPFDLKQLLAFGTISQLGFMMVLFGLGQPEATTAGCALLLAHGLFKASLFMGVGIIDHEVHTRDVRSLPSLGRGWGPTKVVMVVSAASMAAVPPLAGFIAKESAYDALLHGNGWNRVVLAGIVVGSMLTVAYSARLAAAVLRPDVLVEVGEPQVLDERSPSWRFLAPAAVLATATVVLGVAPALWSRLIDAAANALDPVAHAHLALWHGVNTALGLSLLTLLFGAGLFAARRPIEALQARFAPRCTGEVVYDRVVAATTGFAGRLTSVVQSGSLPVYAAIILATAAIVPLAGMVLGPWWPGWPDLVGRVAHIPIAALLVVGGLAATLAHRRFAAALLLGVVGYGMALLFVVQGAPDLALTQFSVETLSVVVFLLVLRRLPDRFERPAPAMGQLVRIGVSFVVGLSVTLFAIAAMGARTQPSAVSREMSARALPDGDGKNVVNVILVDIRGLDTVGEVTVLVAAGIGITALARAGHTPARRRTRRGRTAGGDA